MDENLKELILEAFSQAFTKKGDLEWYKMTAPVLKNRLLVLTDDKFDEKKFGIQRISEMDQIAGDLLTKVDGSSPTVFILGEKYRSKVVVRKVKFTASIRIRDDLWRAVLDFSGDETWVWDSIESDAKTSEHCDSGIKLPTITRDGYRDWRKEFAEEHNSDLGDEEKSRLESWADRVLSDRHLPGRLVGQWNEKLKQNVFEVLDHWFRERGVESPSDLLGPKTIYQKEDEQVLLRKFIISCVQVMSHNELKGVNIPADVAYRVRFKN